MAERKFPDWASDDIPDIGDGFPNKSDPGTVKQGVGWVKEKPALQHMNWIQNLFGHFARANNEYKEEATTYEAEAGEIIVADNSAAVATILLPASPINGQWVEVGGAVAFSTNAVHVDGNGNDIMIAADTSCELDIDYRSFRFHWHAVDNMWKIVMNSSFGRVVV